MPTPLPSGRRFWRRFAMAPEDRRNLTATGLEFALALGFVAIVVCTIALLSGRGLALPFTPPEPPLLPFGP